MGFYLGIIIYLFGAMVTYGILYHEDPKTADSNAGCAVIWPLYGFVMLLMNITKMLRAVPIAIVDRIKNGGWEIDNVDEVEDTDPSHNYPGSESNKPASTWHQFKHERAEQPGERPPPPPAPPRGRVIREGCPSPYPQGRPIPPKPVMPPNDIVIEHEVSPKKDKFGDV